jgi:mannose-6-phosphate isomerase
MACSDNVVRAGLTPKLKDVPTLVNMLTYNTTYPIISRGRVIDECTTRYEPPCPDFCVEFIHVSPGQYYEVMDVESPSVLLTLSGDGILKQDTIISMPVSYGSSIFQSANTRCTIIAGMDGIQLVRAFTNIFHDDYVYAGIDY